MSRPANPSLQPTASRQLSSVVRRPGLPIEFHSQPIAPMLRLAMRPIWLLAIAIVVGLSACNDDTIQDLDPAQVSALTQQLSSDEDFKTFVRLYQSNFVQASIDELESLSAEELATRNARIQAIVAKGSDMSVNEANLVYSLLGVRNASNSLRELEAIVDKIAQKYPEISRVPSVQRADVFRHALGVEGQWSPQINPLTFSPMGVQRDCAVDYGVCAGLALGFANGGLFWCLAAGPGYAACAAGVGAGHLGLQAACGYEYYKCKTS